MKKTDVVQTIFHSHLPPAHAREKGLAFAPTNIALCKYWGKRNTELNLPMTSSLSIALPDKGAMTTLSVNDLERDHIILNDEEISVEHLFAKRITAFLDLFRPMQKWYLNVHIKMNIPVAAGLASSACGFASLTLALNDLFDWRLSLQQLSILARLGSGSASRSCWNGFVEWHMGAQPDGMDSFGEPLSIEWPALRVGLLTLNKKEKPVSSRDAMQRTVDTSMLYQSWPKKVSQDLVILRQALHSKNFSLLGGITESNALSMHATMLSSWPPICYFLPETIEAIQTIWRLREKGLSLYFTQDAGPNLKLLFLEQDQEKVKQHFPMVDINKVFES